MIENPVRLVGDPRELRITDNWKNLMKSGGATQYDLTLKVCVDTEGDVDEVTVHDPPAMNETGIGGVYRGWMHDRHWRYQPHIVDGKKSPFCHLLSLHYSFPPKESNP